MFHEAVDFFLLSLEPRELTNTAHRTHRVACNGGIAEKKRAGIAATHQPEGTQQQKTYQRGIEEEVSYHNNK